MAQKSKAKKTKTKRKRTAEKNKLRWSAPRIKKWPAPKVDVVDEALKRSYNF
jgi:hypothetical protein